MNIYAIYGKNEYRAMEAYKRVLRENQIPKDRIVTLDAGNVKTFSIDALLIECNTLSLFEESLKAVVVKDPYFLKASDKTVEKEKKKKDTVRETFLKKLESYLKSPNPSTVLIFYLSGADMDIRKKETKLLDTYHVEKIACNEIKPWEFPAHIQELLDKHHFVLDRFAKHELEERVGTDEFQLHQALEKMKLYGEKKYDVHLIQQLIPEDTNLDIWKLGNALVSKNLEQCMKQKEAMCSKGMSAMEIFPLLASQLRRAYNIRFLYDQGYTESRIATRLHMKESVVRMNMHSLYSRSSSQLLKMLVKLAEMDQNAKQGIGDPDAQLEMFILQYGV